MFTFADLVIKYSGKDNERIQREIINYCHTYTAQVVLVVTLVLALSMMALLAFKSLHCCTKRVYGTRGVLSAVCVTELHRRAVWVDSVRYSGVCVTRSTHFSCCFDNDEVYSQSNADIYSKKNKTQFY